MNLNSVSFLKSFIYTAVKHLMSDFPSYWNPDHQMSLWLNKKASKRNLELLLIMYNSSIFNRILEKECFPFSGFLCVGKLSVSACSDMIYCEYVLVHWQLLMLTLVSRSCLSALCWFFWLAVPEKSVSVLSLRTLKTEMKKTHLKIWLTVLQHKMQFKNNGVSQCQINSNACGLLMLCNSR